MSYVANYSEDNSEYKTKEYGTVRGMACVVGDEAHYINRHGQGMRGDVLAVFLKRDTIMVKRADWPRPECITLDEYEYPRCWFIPKGIETGRIEGVKAYHPSRPLPEYLLIVGWPNPRSWLRAGCGAFFFVSTSPTDGHRNGPSIASAASESVGRTKALKTLRGRKNGLFRPSPCPHAFRKADHHVGI